MLYEKIRLFFLAFAFFALIMLALTSAPRYLSRPDDPVASQVISPKQFKDGNRIASSPAESRNDPAVQMADYLSTSGNSSAEHDFGIKKTSLDQPLDATAEIQHGRQQLENLGARDILLSGRQGRFEVRCLVPIAAGSPYEKPFSVAADHPVQALLELTTQVQQFVTRNPPATRSR